MAARSTITVNDRATTPVAHAFTPRGDGEQTGTTMFAESAAVPAGDRKIIVRTRRSDKKYIVSLVLSNPTLVTETINGVSVPSVTRTAYGEVSFRFDELSTLQERKDTVGMLANALVAAQTMLDASLTGLEAIW